MATVLEIPTGSVVAGDGIKAADWAINNLSGSKTMQYDDGWIEATKPYAEDFSKRHVLECKDFVYFSYKLGTNNATFPRNAKAMEAWFMKNGTYLTGTSLQTTSVQKGDVLFLNLNGKLAHLALVSDVRSDGTFSIQGAQGSTGTDIIREKDFMKNGVESPYYFSSINQYWINYMGNNKSDGRDFAGIGRL